MPLKTQNKKKNKGQNRHSEIRLPGVPLIMPIKTKISIIWKIPNFTSFSYSLFIYYFFVCLLFLGIIGGTPDKRIFEGLFCCFFWFWVFIGIIGGIPDKRISEGLF